MPPDQPHPHQPEESLSPVSRRAFFRRVGKKVAALGVFGTAVGTMVPSCGVPIPTTGGRSGGGSSGGYSDGGGY